MKRHAPHILMRSDYACVFESDPCLTQGKSSDPRMLEEEDVVEVSLLLPGWQMSALEQAAYQRGQTAAEMLRQMLSDFIAETDESR